MNIDVVMVMFSFDDVLNAFYQWLCQLKEKNIGGSYHYTIFCNIYRRSHRMH